MLFPDGAITYSSHLQNQGRQHSKCHSPRTPSPFSQGVRASLPANLQGRHTSVAFTLAPDIQAGTQPFFMRESGSRPGLARSTVRHGHQPDATFACTIFPSLRCSLLRSNTLCAEGAQGLTGGGVQHTAPRYHNARAAINTHNLAEEKDCIAPASRVTPTRRHVHRPAKYD